MTSPRTTDVWLCRRSALIDMISAGESMGEIAKAFNVSRGAVSGQMHTLRKLGLIASERRPKKDNPVGAIAWTDAMDDTIRVMRVEHKASFVTIAKALGINHCTIRKRTLKLSLPLVVKPRHVAVPGTWAIGGSVERLTELWNSGMSASLIAMQFGISRNSIIGKAYRLGLTPREAIKPAKREPKPRVRIVRAVVVKSVPKVQPLNLDVLPKVDRLHCFVATDRETVDISDLKSNMCRWPFGEHSLTFCGGPIDQTRTSCSYCAEHAAIASMMPRTPAQRASDEARRVVARRAA